MCRRARSWICWPGVDDARSFDELLPLVFGLNYADVTLPGMDPRVRQLNRPRAGEPTHQVYLVERGTPFWDQALAFRDRLQGSPLDRYRYGSFKQHLAETFATDPEAYLEAKLTFIRSTLTRD